jgi:hypothetical protein
MSDILILLVIWAGFLGMSFWESSVEGREAWHKKKYGWEIKIGKFVLTTRYHFFLFFVMTPAFLSLPLVIYGWDLRLFGILLSGYFSGLAIEDFGWYLTNTEVKIREFWSKFSDYYPWVRIGKKKIIPVLYIIGFGLAILSWVLFWK